MIMILKGANFNTLHLALRIKLRSWLIIFQGLRSPWGWLSSRIVRFSGRLRNRNCWRRWCAWNCTTTKAVRWHDSYSNFCGSVGSVWTHCCYLSIRQIDAATPKTVLLLEYLCLHERMAPNERKIWSKASSCFVTSDYTIRFISIDLDFAKIFILSLKLFR